MKLEILVNCPICLTWRKNMFDRKKYLDQLISVKGDSQVKVITGLRRVGKSFLLKNIYIHHLLSSGVPEENIILINLEEIENAPYRNPLALHKKILSSIKDESSMNYVFIDEIQYCGKIPNPDIEGAEITFYDVCNSLKNKPFIDLYVTGSNSHLLSKDILTEFRGRGEEINVRPLSFKEALEASADEDRCFEEYLIYGGLPLVISKKSPEEKAKTLNDLRQETYIKDICEKHDIADNALISSLGRIFSTTTGSLASIQKLADSFSSLYKKNIAWETVNKYVEAFKDSFLLEEAGRYDLVGRKNLVGPRKYYFSDNGLLNSFSSFSHIEMQQLLENTIYNELIYRGYSVEIGVINKRTRKNGIDQYTSHEIDFVASKYNRKYYIQAAVSIDDEGKEEQEKRPLRLSKDFFKKLIIVKDEIIPRKDEEGILTIGVKQFLLDESALDL